MTSPPLALAAAVSLVLGIAVGGAVKAEKPMPSVQRVIARQVGIAFDRWTSNCHNPAPRWCTNRFAADIRSLRFPVAVRGRVAKLLADLAVTEEIMTIGDDTYNIANDLGVKFNVIFSSDLQYTGDNASSATSSSTSGG